jgi:integrase
MAYVRSYTSKTQKRNGKPVKTYQVVWREQATDPRTGLPITGRTRNRSEAYPARETAEARRAELNDAKYSAVSTSQLSNQRRAGVLTFGHYAQAWLAAQRVKAASGGNVKPATVDGYAKRLAVYALPAFGGKAIASITPADCEQFLAALVGQNLAPATLKHHWSTTKQVFTYAVRHRAIAANPVDGVDFSINGAQRRNARHYPLTAEQVAQIAASIGERYPVYELLTLFMAYTGLRAEEVAGLEVGDITQAHINVQRAKKRRAGHWVTDTLKSAKSRRTVPLPPWLAARMADYLAEHPRRDETTAPLWPNRALGGERRRGCRAIAPLDYTEPVDPGAFYKNLFRPALEAVGLPASRPAYTRDDGTPVAAVQGVRLHDLRHTFATLQLSAGVHFMQVSQWLGHATYTLTLDVYGGYIPQADGGVPNALPEPEPTVRARPATATVLPFRHTS